MKQLLLTFVLSLMTALTVIAGKPFTLKDATGGAFRAQRQRSVTPLPDGMQYACIEKGDRIVAYSYKDGKQTSVLFDPVESKGEKVTDLADFLLAPDGSKMLLATDVHAIYRHSFTAEWFVYDVKTKTTTHLSQAGAQQRPVWSPDSRKIAFVRKNNIYVSDIVNSTEIQITTDGKFNSIINGIPDWVNEEEFGFDCSMAFTGDSRRICWLRYDETQVKTYALQLFKGMKPERKDNADYPGEYAYKYPKAGQKNADVEAWSCDIASLDKQKIALPVDSDGYVCRIFTAPYTTDGVVLVTLNRHQDDMRIYAADAVKGQCRMILQEKDKKYVPEAAYGNLVLTDRYILMLSDRDGYRHLYLYTVDGKLVRSICPESVDITDVYGFDQKTGDVFYQAAPTPMTRHIYVSHRNGRIDRLSTREGQNAATFSATMAYYFNTWSDRNTPYVCTSNDRRGKVLSTLVDNKELRERLAEYDMPDKELFSFTTADGVVLNGWMMKPVDFDATKRYPVIMHQYSGPGSQQVNDSWRMGSMGEGAIFDAYLCSLGFIVVTVDGRGTGARGAEFEKCTYLRLGELESHDQVETAVWLASQPWVDKEHIGIWGWSFGGFNTLMSMSEGRPVFYAGVAIAPPTNWKYYDTIYTERFMRTPQENPDGYAVNPIQRVDKLHGRLLICHGLADDNVHPQNTFEYSEAAVQADKDFRELVYTNRNHSIFGGNTRYHLLRQVVTHFLESK